MLFYKQVLEILKESLSTTINELHSTKDFIKSATRRLSEKLQRFEISSRSVESLKHAKLRFLRLKENYFPFLAARVCVINETISFDVGERDTLSTVAEVLI